MLVLRGNSRWCDTSHLYLMSLVLVMNVDGAAVLEKRSETDMAWTSPCTAQSACCEAVRCTALNHLLFWTEGICTCELTLTMPCSWWLSFIVFSDLTFRNGHYLSQVLLATGSFSLIRPVCSVMSGVRRKKKSSMSHGCSDTDRSGLLCQHVVFSLISFKVTWLHYQNATVSQRASQLTGLCQRRDTLNSLVIVAKTRCALFSPALIGEMIWCICLNLCPFMCCWTCFHFCAEKCNKESTSVGAYGTRICICQWWRHSHPLLRLRS